MADEVEAKIRVSDFRPVRKRLRSLGAERISSGPESNWLFDTKGRDLAGTGRALRLRKDRHVVLTYKGKRRASAFKRREEIEVQLSDLDAMQQILERLGLSPIFRYEKKRETWKLGRTIVTLDTLEKIGTFVEVEAPSETAVRRGLKQLGLADHPIEERTYLELLGFGKKRRGQ